MTVSTKPYLIRALYEWCVDQGFTPYIAAAVDDSTRVPPGYANDGQIVLNVSPDAANQLQMDNDQISFQARFGGVAQSIRIPVANVVAIYARENGHGMAFEVEADSEQGEAEAPGADEAPMADASGDDSDPGDDDPPRPPARSGHLKVIK